ncbi:glycine cleavage system aminomethyltransferase GcvT [Synechocystis sp. LKSZ1]|uniref:glycine cleavage system aminomethyltransferase GcvT n=1 Tax=Synechocystis sp. LKSZ1 TaxID=3144951 RepID=UPI00336BF495
MTAFAGWDMPVQFSGLKQEHLAVRQQVGLFDISHMGKFRLVGPKVLSFLQGLVPSNLHRLATSRAQYTVLLNAQAGIIDDIIIYNHGGPADREEVTLIVNAATTEKDKQWLLPHCQQAGVELQDLSQELVLLALQGPQALSTLQRLFPQDFSELPTFAHQSIKFNGESIFLARTGYTGEDGFEIMASAETGQKLWQTWLDWGVTPCGLGARDTLRLEAGLGLYGQDMDEQTTPLEAGLGWLVHRDKPDPFIGQAILERQRQNGLAKKLVALVMEDRHIARPGYAIVCEGQPVGRVTSGTLSPFLDQAIALAYVPPAWSQPGQSLGVEIRGKIYAARVVKRPFYRRP